MLTGWKLFSLSLIAGVVSSPAQSPTTLPGSIQWYAERAKQQGDMAVTVESPRGMHERITTLDQALSTYQVVVGTPVAAATLLADSNHVYTWYKLKILEDLISHPNPEVAAVSIPESLLPITASEMVIRIPEGSLTVDGVKVTIIDHDVHLLTLNKKYLFFLSPDSSGRFAYLRSGSNAIFPVNPGNKIVSSTENRTLMKDDLDSSTGGSLDSLREFAKIKAAERSPNK